MKNKVIIKCIMKLMPLYIVSIVSMLLCSYIDSLSGLFVGEVLGILNGDSDILPGALINFIDKTSVKSQITSVSIIYVVVVSIRIIFFFISRYTKNLHQLLLDKNLSLAFYKHVLDLPKSEFVNRSTGDIIQRNIEDCRRVTKLFKDTIFDIFRIISQATTVLIQFYILSKVVFVYSLIILIICLMFSWYYGYFKIKKREINSSKYYSELNSTLQQSITNYSLVKSFANEEYEYNKFKEINDKKESNNYTINNLHCKYWLLSDLLTSAYLIGCLIILAITYFNGKISLSAVSAIAILATNFLNGATQLINYITGLVKTFISIRRLNEYFNIETEYVNDGTKTNEIEGNIIFENVCMKYDKDDVLKDITFELKKGETLGIVGKSGSGKTSIVNLLTRLDDYSSGSIKIDGVELKDYKKKYIRENMGVVLQDAYIFSKTIKENLLVLVDNDRIDLDMYLKRVGLDEDINKFESGLETIVGERGVTLSGGQRQRISLLRTIMKNKKILILDDTLSAVDNIVARKIKNSITKEKATTIIISHNLLNVKDADKIIVLDKGRIVDIGTHDELIQREGFYSNVWNLQQMIQEVDD